jgi:hypothetical protein
LGGAKTKTIKKLKDKILILILIFFCEKKNFWGNFGAWGGQAPLAPM